MYQCLRFNEFEEHGYQKKIERAEEILESGSWSALDVKKLKDKNMYRAKLDDKARLIFQLGEFQKRKFILLLEVLKNHEYDRSRFLHSDLLLESDFQISYNGGLEDPQIGIDQLVYINEKSSRFQILDKVISFDDSQSEIFQINLPLIVVGSAGSGKTALMLEKMKTLPGQGLYVTHSKFLCENSCRIYYSLNYQNDSQEVDFLSYKEYLQSIHVPNGRELHFNHFNSWWQKVKIGCPIKDPHKLFEEFKGVLSGFSIERSCLERKEYLNLGVRQSIFSEAERPLVFELFQKYLTFLKTEGFYDLNIVSFESLNLVKPKYDFVVLDEIQDLTNIQILLILKSLKKPGEWFLCGDSNQIVHPNFFSWSKIKSLFYESQLNGSKNILRVLNNNFRNSKRITDLANRILILKNQRFGSIDRESNFLVSSRNHQEGKIVNLAYDEKLLSELNKKTAKSSKSAVIVPNDEVKLKAQKIFQTPLIFNIHEAKGLEYRDIILFDFASEYREEFRHICDGIAALEEKEFLNYSRAKDKTDKSMEIYKFFINSLYVAVTRSMQNLLWIESSPEQKLLDLLILPKRTNQLDLQLEESSLEDWRAEALRLEKQGKFEQALKIHKLILLDKQPVPWKVIGSEQIDQFSRIFSQQQTTKVDKNERQVLFHYSLVDDVSMWKNHLAKYRGKTVLSDELLSIKNKYHLEYLGKNYSNLEKKIQTYGIDFQNPFGQTPLQVAAYLGVQPLIQILLKSGASMDRRDNWGRLPLAIAIYRALTDESYRRGSFVEVYEELSKSQLSFRSRDRLFKMSRRPFEYLLLQLIWQHYQLGAIGDVAHSPHYFVLNSERLQLWVQDFPDEVIPPHRKKQSYLSSILAKNEVEKDDPYNRGLFVRKTRGEYFLNPEIAFEMAEDQWVGLPDLLFLNHPLQEIGQNRGVKWLKELWPLPVITTPLAYS